MAVHGILAAPPCTDLAVSGVRYWAAKGEQALLAALAVADACLRIVTVCRLAGALAWWALENPVGRLRHYYGPPPSDVQSLRFRRRLHKAHVAVGRIHAATENAGRAGARLFAGFMDSKAGRKKRPHKNAAQHDPRGIRPRIFRGEPLA